MTSTFNLNYQNFILHVLRCCLTVFMYFYLFSVNCCYSILSHMTIKEQNKCHTFALPGVFIFQNGYPKRKTNKI